MSRHYDMILFENFKFAQNHKFDVLLIAKLLTTAGKSVAILDYYNDEEGDEKEGIPLIHHHVAIPDELCVARPKNPLKCIVSSLRYFKVQESFASEVIKEVKDMASLFYCGSYHAGMSYAWLNLDKPCYFWGLRSNRFKHSAERFSEGRIAFFRIAHLRRLFLKNPFMNLFVSNELIRDEFIAASVPADRIVVRPERVIEKADSVSASGADREFSFLCIGNLRPDKRIEYVIDSFSTLNRQNCKLLIIGKSLNDYEARISQAIAGKHDIVRVNATLDYNEFLHYFKRSNFVVFADRQIEGTVTNGTLGEALISGRPVIVPDYSPYSDLLDKYKVGIKYDPSVPGALSDAMMLAMETGIESFLPEIRRYLETIEFKNVSENLARDIFSKQLR